MKETWVWALGWEDPWRRKWQPTLVFLAGKSHGQRSLVGYSPWGRTGLDMTERLTATNRRVIRSIVFHVNVPQEIGKHTLGVLSTQKNTLQAVPWLSALGAQLYQPVGFQRCTSAQAPHTVNWILFSGGEPGLRRVSHVLRVENNW